MAFFLGNFPLATVGPEYPKSVGTDHFNEIISEPDFSTILVPFQVPSQFMPRQSIKSFTKPNDKTQKIC